MGVEQASVASPARPWSRYRDLLGSRDFTAFWSALSLSLIGDMFSYLALAWLVLSLTGSGAALGAVLAVQGIPRVVFMLAAGDQPSVLGVYASTVLTAPLPLNPPMA